MPLVGFGCWNLDKSMASQCVKDAISLGYRHIDSAANYGNEEEVGQGIYSAITEGLCAREELFITSKLWNTYHSPDHVEMACRRSLDDLKLEYFDLYLIHFPISLKFVPFEERYPPGWSANPKNSKVMEFEKVSVQETWRAMETLVEKGLVRNIGVSNWNCQGLRDLLSFAKIRPSVLQVEMHPYLQNSNLLKFAQSLGLTVTAFSPLGNGKSYSKLGYQDISCLEDPVILNIAKNLNITPAQVVLKWALDRGSSVVTKSVNKQRLAFNLDLFSFKLSDQDTKQIEALDRNLRFNDPGHYCLKLYDTLCPIWD